MRRAPFLLGSATAPSPAARVTALLDTLHRQHPPPEAARVPGLARAVQLITHGSDARAMEELEALGANAMACERAIEFSLRDFLAGGPLSMGYVAIGWACLGFDAAEAVRRAGIERGSGARVVRACEQVVVDACYALGRQLQMDPTFEVVLEKYQLERAIGYRAVSKSRVDTRDGTGRFRAEALFNLLGKQHAALARLSVRPLYPARLRVVSRQVGAG